jgi:hypothetical protein
MAGETTFSEGFREPERSKAFETTMGGSGLEAIGGITAIVLGLLGLLGVLPGLLAAIGVIIIGVGLISQGTAVAARYEELLKALETGGSARPAAELAGGMTTEFMGGLAGIVLGVLALLGIAPLTVMATALIVFGATLLMSTAETSRLISMGSLQGERARQIFRVAVPATAGGQVLVGLASMILGILALVMAPHMSLTLILVGILAVGAALLFSGSAVAGRLILLLKH